MAGKKILIVDDEEMITCLCHRVLTREDYEVRCALSGEEAFSIAGSWDVDMVLTDMLMPGISGLDTFNSLKEKHKGLVGLLMTAHGTMDLAIDAMKMENALPAPANVVKETFLRASLLEENVRLKTLLPLYDLSERFISSQSRKEILDAFIQSIEQQMGVQRVSVMLYDDVKGGLKIVASRGIQKGVVARTRIETDEKIAGRVF